MRVSICRIPAHDQHPREAIRPRSHARDLHADGSVLYPRVAVKSEQVTVSTRFNQRTKPVRLFIHAPLPEEKRCFISTDLDS